MGEQRLAEVSPANLSKLLKDACRSKVTLPR
jgi:hypothetical protein